ncbi:ADYC domain-containing protein [Phenylobacterium sp.]|jgi:hypothetical protein|uniref:ADYC domain-containing protein n=1 Tax=Phenylobacterium sp. TaxID=1871053 RepID=UPI0035B063D3
MRLRLAFAVFAALMFAAPAASAAVQVRETRFELTLPDGRTLGSEDLVGAEMEIRDERGEVFTARLDAIEPAAEDPAVLLHRFSMLDARSGQWRPLCNADAYGRRAGFPVAGRWDAKGRYVKDPQSWFLTCTSGSQGKCVLWGYNPFRKAPSGADLAPFYQACQHMVRADYDGRGAPHTRNGTLILWGDVAGVSDDASDDPSWKFEAGWGPDGAVCVARTRWENLLPTAVLLESQPRLAAAPCDKAEARRRGALLFNHSK